MLKGLTILSFLLLAITNFFSCSSKRPDIYTDIDDTASFDQIFIKEIPTYNEGPLKGQTDFIYPYIKKQTTELRLDNIQSGFNALQIRIWLNVALKKKKHLVILKRTSQKWTGQLVTINTEYNDSINEHFIKTSNFQNVTPKSGWDNLFKELTNQKLFTLPDMNQIPDYRTGEDGFEFVVEYATNTKYRLYHYWSPSIY